MQALKRKGRMITGKKAVLLTAFFVCLLFPSFFSRAQEPMAAEKKIKVAYPIHEGFTNVDEDGKYSGYTYEYLRKLSQLTGWEYEFIQVEGDNNEALEDLLNKMTKGEIDLMGGLVKDASTEALFDFSGSSYGMAYSTLSVLEGNNLLNERNLTNAKIKIGVIKASTKRRAELEQFCQNNLIKAEMKEFTDGKDLIEALLKKEVDAVLGVDISPYKGTKIIAKFGGVPYYFATTKGNVEILQSLNASMIQLENAEPYFESRIYEKYFGNKETEFTLTEEEQQYLKEKKEIIVFVPNEVDPFQRKEEEVYTGITASILEKFAEKTNLQIKYKTLEEGEPLFAKVDEGIFDFVLGVPYDYDFAEDYNLVLSTPYLTTQTTLFSKKPIDLNNLKGKKLALTENAVAMEEVKDAEIIWAKSLRDCIRLVESGDADFGYGNNYSVAYYLSERVYPNLVMYPVFNKSRSYSFGFSLPADMDLLVILNRYIEQMDENMLHTELMREIAGVDRDVRIIDYIKLNPTKVIFFLFAGVFILLLIVFYFAKISQEKNLLKAQKEAQENFLSNMSHEMRTPLNTIVGLSDLAEANIDNPTYVKDCIEKIDTASVHLLELINNILDMSRISEGKMRLLPKKFHLIEMIESIDTVYEADAKRKKIKISTEIDERIIPYIEADELRLKQVLINLLLNGIKYNQSGGEVLIRADFVKRTQSTQTICFSVVDTGCGIKEENQKKIFDAFEREERIESIAGTGLGLPISARIVKLMGGELKVASKVEEGSRFWFEIEVPIVAVTEEAKDKKVAIEIPYDFKGIRFLLFEDNEINATIVQKLLEAKQGEVTIVENGKIGCELFEKSQEGYFDIILMDIRMPIMNGYEATAYIRNLEREDALHIPIFALSANAFLEDVKKSKELGMNEHLAKPIDKAKLFQTIREYSIKE